MTNISDTGDQILAWVRLRISGEDAKAYLQGQITQDVGLAAQGAWTYILQPDSTVLSVGWLSSDGSDLLLDVSDESFEEVLGRLKRFILRSRVQVSAESCTSPVLKNYREAFEMNYPVHLPVGDFTPHSFGQDWITRGVCFTKGCYTGQELVGRLDARQAPVPFRIVRLKADSLDSIEELVHQGSQKDKQSVLWGFNNGDEYKAVAILHRTCLTPEFLGSHPLVELLDIKP